MAEWKNRIVGEGEESPDQLLANPANFRIHSKTQQSALAAVLDEVGWVQRVVVNKTTGHIVDGHMRVSLGISRNEATIPVSYVELSLDEERLILSTFDPIGALATTDREQLRTLIGDLNAGEAAQVAKTLHEKAIVVGEQGAGPELRLAPEINERQDYLVITFDNELDWRTACDKLGVVSSRDADANPETQKGRAFGLGRVLTAAELLKRLA